MASCKTCGGWVNPIEALDTDEGRFHDRLTCLAAEEFEELVARYGCRCAQASTFTELEWIEHLDEEHSKSADVGRVTPQEKAEALRVHAFLTQPAFEVPR